MGSFFAICLKTQMPIKATRIAPIIKYLFTVIAIMVQSIPNAIKGIRSQPAIKAGRVSALATLIPRIRSKPLPLQRQGIIQQVHSVL